MYVETRGPTLEELARVIDGDDAKVANMGVKVEEDAVLGKQSEEITEKE